MMFSFEHLANWIETLWFSLSHFMGEGGAVLWVLALVAGGGAFLIIEHLLYLFFVFPQQEIEWKSKWAKRTNRASWASGAVRDAWLFEAHIQLFRHLDLIKSLVQICPMLGLLGTVTGMIFVFDAQSMQRVAEYREIASGISKATLPTFAGMLIAFIGAFSHSRLTLFCQRKDDALAKALRSK